MTATCLNHFVLIEVCIGGTSGLVRVRISATFIGDLFRDTHLREHFGRTDKAALMAFRTPRISTYQALFGLPQMGV